MDLGDAPGCGSCAAGAHASGQASLSAQDFGDPAGTACDLSIPPGCAPGQTVGAAAARGRHDPPAFKFGGAAAAAWLEGRSSSLDIPKAAAHIFAEDRDGSDGSYASAYSLGDIFTPADPLLAAGDHGLLAGAACDENLFLDDAGFLNGGLAGDGGGDARARSGLYDATLHDSRIHGGTAFGQSASHSSCWLKAAAPVPESPHGSAPDSGALAASTVGFPDVAGAGFDFPRTLTSPAPAFAARRARFEHAGFGQDFEYGPEHGPDSSRHSDGSHHSGGLGSHHSGGLASRHSGGGGSRHSGGGLGDGGSFYLPGMAELLPSRPYAFRHAAPALDDPYTPFDEADDVLSLAHLDAQPGAAAPAPPSPARARPGARRPPSRPRAPPARAGSPELRCATPDGGVNGKRGAAAASGLSEGRRVRAAVLARGRAGRPRRAFADADSDASEPEVNRRRKHHNPWNVEETEALVTGVEACGNGKWADIKKLGFRAIHGRSAVDLKDKWRNLLRVALMPSTALKSKTDKRREVPPELLARVCAIIKAPPPNAPGDAPSQAAYRIVRGRARPVGQS